MKYFVNLTATQDSYCRICKKDLVCGPSPQAASSPYGGPGLQRRHSISICESGKLRRKKSSSPSSAADSACPSSGSGSSASGSPRHSRMEGGGSGNGPVSMMPTMMSALNVKTFDEEDNQVHKCSNCAVHGLSDH